MIDAQEQDMAREREHHRTAETVLQEGAATNTDANGPVVLSGIDIPFLGVDGQQFTIKAHEVIAYGAEATIFGATCDNDTDTGFANYVAKVSYRHQDPHRRQQHVAVVKSICGLNQIAGLNHHKSTHLVPIVTYGETTDTLDNQTLHYDVTIMPRCEELGPTGYNRLRDQVVPAGYAAIEKLHTLGIIHRDIKPGHLLVLDGEVCLADFGISRELGIDKSVGVTKHDDHTPGYSPTRDHFRIRPESDWYSFGYTLWALYNGGQHPLQEYIDSDGSLTRALANGCPISVSVADPSHEPLSRLIQGLIREDPGERIGPTDIAAWLENPVAFELPKPAVDASAPPAAATIRPFRMGDTSIETMEDLIDTLASTSNWSMAKRHLYRRNIEEWCRQNLLFDLALTLSRISEEDSDTVHDQDLGLARALFMMSDKKIMCWYGLDVRLKPLGELLKINAREVEIALTRLLISGFMAWAIERLTNAGNPLVTFFKQLQYIGSECPTMAYFMARSYFATQLTNGQERTDDSGWTNPDEAFRDLTHAPCEFYEIVGCQRATEALLGFLAVVSGVEKAAAARNELVFVNDCTFRNAEVVLRLFESICTDKKMVRAFYRDFGPKGDLFWVSSHIDLYRPMTQTAGRIAGRILENRLNRFIDTSIEKISVWQTTVEQEIANLYEEFNNDPLVRQHSARTNGRGFFSEELDCYFLHEFHGRIIPHGYALDLMRNLDADKTTTQGLPVRIGVVDIEPLQQQGGADTSAGRPHPQTAKGTGAGASFRTSRKRRPATTR
jgi:hypothetical protein